MSDRRADGSKKGPGFLGPLLRPDGSVSTELSMGTSDVDGVEREIPTIVPTLSNDELRWLLNTEPSAGDIPDSIASKAIDHARQRLQRGQSIFAPSLQIQRTGQPLAPDFAEALQLAIKRLVYGR